MTGATTPEGIGMMTVALLCDVVSISATFLIGIPACLVLDVLCLLIIGGWMFSRSNRKGSSDAVEEEEEEAEPTPPDISSMKKDRSGSKLEGKEATKKAEKEMAQEAEKATAKGTAKTTAKKTTTKKIKKVVVKKTFKKIIMRMGTAFLGTLIPVLQIWPFWTKAVMKELKE